MPVLETMYKHIGIDTKGVSSIKGTSMKVIELIVEKIAYEWSPKELHFQHPYLTLGQIHSALAYYWDHADKLEQDITERLNNIKTLQKKTALSPLVTKLKLSWL